MSERPIFNVAQLLKEPIGATRVGQVNTRLQDLVPELELELEDGPEVLLTGPVRLMHTTDGVLVQGDLEAEVTLECIRCLEPVVESLEVPVEETFVPTMDVDTGQAVRPPEQDEALWIDDHHVFDMSEVLRQDVLVALPVHVVCRSDCKGLCPTCGKNLNEGPCDCQSEPDPRWARLTDLLGDEQHSNSEKE